MPQPIVLPPQQSPWQRMMPFIQNMIMQRSSQNFRREQLEEQRKYNKGLLGEERDYNQTLLKEQREWQTKQKPVLQKTTDGGTLLRLGTEFKYYPPKDQALPKLTKLINQRNKLPLGSPSIKLYDQAIQKEVSIDNKTATTPMGHYLKMNPDATPGQVLAYYKQMQKDPSLTEVELTRRALNGDKDAAAILEAMLGRKKDVAYATGEGMAGSKINNIIDVQGTARAIVEGRELFTKVKNTFGVPVQEAIRKEVLEVDPNFDFVTPTIKHDAIKSSHAKLQNQRVMMGSFVNNLNKQVDRVNSIMKDISQRLGVRAIDLPYRELKKRAKGSGIENVIEAYTVEISNEIGKLSTGSERSIRELSSDAQERWSKIHDPNLSFKQLKIILDETSHMANMRVDSVEEQIEYNLNTLNDLTKNNDELPMPKNINDYNKLPSGSIYIDPDDGKKYRKP